MVSPIVVRGYGKNPRIVTRGYGPGFIAAVIEGARRGGSKAKRKIKHTHEELVKFTVTAMLVAVNETEQSGARRGQQTAEITKLDVRFKASFKAITRLGYLTERIIINAFRVVRRGFKKIED
jgi:hypothetical protein